MPLWLVLLCVYIYFFVILNQHTAPLFELSTQKYNHKLKVGKSMRNNNLKEHTIPVKFFRTIYF